MLEGLPRGASSNLNVTVLMGVVNKRDAKQYKTYEGCCKMTDIVILQHPIMRY